MELCLLCKVKVMHKYNGEIFQTQRMRRPGSADDWFCKGAPKMFWMNALCRTA